MTAALLWAAGAVLVWPDRRAERRQRAALVCSRPGRRVPRVPGLDRRHLPLLAPAATVAVVAALSTPLVALLAGAAALAGMRSWTATRRERAQDRRLAGLAEGLGALAAELRSGRALEQAVAAATAACGDEESGRALGRAVQVDRGTRRRAGAVARGDALGAATDRISAAVLLSVRTGCSLAGVVAAVDADLRVRRAHRQELRAATAAPRASAMLLAGLPLLGLAMGAGIGADPWRVLTATGAGQVLLVAGIALELAGLEWSRRLVERVLR